MVDGVRFLFVFSSSLTAFSALEFFDIRLSDLRYIKVEQIVIVKNIKIVKKRLVNKNAYGIQLYLDVKINSFVKL